MKRNLLLIILLSALVGLLGCAEAQVPVIGAPIALATGPESSAEALLVPLGGYEDYKLGYYDLDTGEVRWRLELDDIEYLDDVKIAFDDARIYLAAPGYVRAYDRQDGVLAWKTPFEGPVDPYCARCFACMAGRVLVQSKAGRISALETETGEVLWRVSPSRQAHDDLGFYTSPPGADRVVLAFVARVEGEGAVNGMLHLIDVEDGSALRQIEASCTPEEFFGPQTPLPGAFLHFDRQGRAVYVWFEAFPRATCIQAWRVEDGALLWNTLISEEALDSPFFWGDDRDPLLVQLDAIYAGRPGSQQGHGLTRIDLATGDVRALLDEGIASRYVCPMAYQAGIVAVFVREDKMLKVWGVDVTTGDRRWSQTLAEAPAADSYPHGCDLSNSYVFAVGTTSAGLVIVESRSVPDADVDQLRVRLLDVATGEFLQTVERASSYVSLEGVPVAVGDPLYVTVGRGLYRFDTTTGAFEHVLGEEMRDD